ncbi:tryptophan-rich sensory protein [Patescibacteria group bacterium]|nr:tryptophan-rich sensory protein [Patescibacteria group bacterium]
MKNKNFIKLIVALIIPQLLAIVGSLFTSTGPNSWYNLIEKPAFNPPNWVFGPVWTLLYILMGISAFLIWRRGLRKKEVRFALLIFIFQLVLNLFWSFIFFGLENPGIAFTEIISLWFAILATILSFYQVNKVAAFLLIPYILWVSFAAFLNYSIWNLNINTNISAPIAGIEIDLENENNSNLINEEPETIVEINFED